MTLITLYSIVKTATFALNALRVLALVAARESPSNVGHQLFTESGTGGPQEYCLSDESFVTKCLRHEVVVMHSALYGRMKIGRCLEGVAFSTDPRILGCSVNVLPLLDKKCSGRNWCEISRATDVDIKKEKPCERGLESYLEADYECVAVCKDYAYAFYEVVEGDKSCIVTVTSNPLHILRSSSAEKLNCGTKSQPWRLEAPPGQQINISVIDFGPKTGDIFNQLPNNCQQYGYIFDKSGKKNVSICALVRERKKLIYKSSSNIVEIVLNSATATEDITFLLQVIAVGCSELVPPVDAWLKRTEDGAVVGCYISRQTWHLRCIESQWTGVIGNCTRENDELTEPESSLILNKLADGNKNQLMIILAVAFLTLIICVTIICCGAVLLRRYYATMARNQWQKINEIENKRFIGTAPVNPITMNGQNVDI